jgi:hypothetical protein
MNWSRRWGQGIYSPTQPSGREVEMVKPVPKNLRRCPLSAIFLTLGTGSGKRTLRTLAGEAQDCNYRPDGVFQ